jgi:hypothetical protein
MPLSKGVLTFTQLLYDFDYEEDNLSLVQSLMHMTYCYENPDDQKDTWHWISVAISVAQKIGLHRNPESMSIPLSKKRLCKRIWWSCFIRDHLIALGMCRPTRIKDEDFDVPMLLESDFKIHPVASSISIISPECTVMRDAKMQRELAILCISKAKLCLCISRMLKTQYPVHVHDETDPKSTINGTIAVCPNEWRNNADSINAIDVELGAWAASLPDACQYRALNTLDVKEGRSTIAVQRILLHMVYYTTVSALHRPLIFPSSATHQATTSRQTQEMSRLRVCDAAGKITHMATELYNFRLEKYLPTSGVTILLPTMIIHLLDMKSTSANVRDSAMHGFRECMRVMARLRGIYEAADHATRFLDAVLRDASIDGNTDVAKECASDIEAYALAAHIAQTPPPENFPYMTTSEDLFSKKPLLTAKEAVRLRNTLNTSALELSVSSPPHPDFGSAEPMPDDGGQPQEGRILDMDILNRNIVQGHIEFDWNYSAESDVDQWLQYTDGSYNPDMDNNYNSGFGDDPTTNLLDRDVSRNVSELM